MHIVCEQFFKEYLVFRRWQNGQSWALCPVLYIHSDGGRNQEHSVVEDIRQMRNREEKHKP